MTKKSSAHTTAVPAVTFSKTGLLVPDEVDILNGRLSDFSTALGGAMSTSLTTPQGQLASWPAVRQRLSPPETTSCWRWLTINPDFASGRFQDAIGRLYFIDRLGATGTTVTAICTGLAGTQLPVGSVAQDTRGYQYVAVNAATLPASGSAGSRIRPRGLFPSVPGS
ncbi:hypothetical protein [Sodalis glossinidius]|uniref:hypothetical protein n=1 Tax=Sodalis glossinidius TaxID=63612 RepID=UPI0002FFCCA2|nr:hypothetical protein [Sodalis glossinidius]